jgi:ABC-2 type transport system permease protein
MSTATQEEQCQSLRISSHGWDHAGFVQNILIVPLSFLGGVFYSVSVLPSPWREVSHANPIF